MEILLVLQIIVVIALIAVILVQKTSSDGFTGGSSSPNSFLTGRASANLFTRATSILATIFILNSLALAYIASHIDRGESIVDSAMQEAEKIEKEAPLSSTEALEKNKISVPPSETESSAAPQPEQISSELNKDAQKPENTQQPINSVPVSE